MTLKTRHIDIIVRLINHEKYKNAPTFYLADLILQLFPEYRNYTRQDIIDLIDCLSVNN
jgi:hypothetical protein